MLSFCHCVIKSFDNNAGNAVPLKASQSDPFKSLCHYVTRSFTLRDGETEKNLLHA